jgi:hypothetical protein
MYPVLTVSGLCGKPHYLNGGDSSPVLIFIRYTKLALPFAVTDKCPVVETTPVYRLPRDHSEIDAEALCSSYQLHPTFRVGYWNSVQVEFRDN